MQTRIQKLSERLRRQHGQAFVEFAIVLPGPGDAPGGHRAVRPRLPQLSLDHRRDPRRREGCRGQADHGACAAATTAIQNTVSAKQWSTISGRITCTAGVNAGDQVKVIVKYPYRIGLPGFSASGDLTASATERLE